MKYVSYVSNIYLKIVMKIGLKYIFENRNSNIYLKTSIPREDVAPMPTARLNLAAACVAGRIIAVGGSSAMNVTTASEIYDPELGVWQVLPPMPTARDGLAAASLDGKLYAIGGLDNANHDLATAECLDLAQGVWQALPPIPLLQLVLPTLSLRHSRMQPT